jgi:1-deoxy-D-xylulose-5-phosphate reductoisomerase
VSAFLDGRVPFTAIPDTIRAVIGDGPAAAIATLEDVLEADAEARRTARNALAASARVTVRVS